MSEQNMNTIAEPHLGLFSRVINVFFNPSQTFKSLIQKPDWITPLVVSILLMTAFLIFLNGVIQSEQAEAAREAIMKSTRIAESQKEQIAEQQIKMMKSFWFVGIIIGYIAAFALYFLAGLGLWIAGNIILGKGPKYLQVLSVYGYSMLIDILAMAIKIPLMVKNQTIRMDTGLGILISKEESKSVLYSFLSSFDLFTFWELGVLTLGLAILYKASKGKTATMVFVLWFVIVLVKVGFTALGKLFS